MSCRCNHRPQLPTERLPSVIVHRAITISHRPQNHRPRSSSTTIALSHRLLPSPAVIDYNHRPQASSTHPSPSVIVYTSIALSHRPHIHRPQSLSTVIVYRTIALSHRLQNQRSQSLYTELSPCHCTQNHRPEPRKRLRFPLHPPTKEEEKNHRSVHPRAHLTVTRTSLLLNIDQHLLSQHRCASAAHAATASPQYSNNSGQYIWSSSFLCRCHFSLRTT